MATKTALGSEVVSVVDGYAWSIEPTTAQAVAKKELEFEPIAARMLIGGLSQLKNSEGLADLDLMHAIAKTYRVVTPYSSMIVLVNDEQRKALKEAEASTDRFDRKVEDGKEQLNKPNNPFHTTDVPEPSTIAGWIVVAIALLFFFVRQRKLI
jgi:putative PEP-CTERM system integral membrane protein